MKTFFRGKIAWSLILQGLIASPVWAVAELRPNKIHVADAKKNLFYIHDGLFVGGDRAIQDVIVKDIRWATNSGFERIVIDLEGNVNGEAAAIPRPPYYQVAVNPDENRLILTLWGHPKLAFNPKKVLAAFKKGVALKNISLFPLLEEDSWTFAFELKSGRPVEVFELSNPVRVIVDIRKGAK